MLAGSRTSNLNARRRAMLLPQRRFHLLLLSLGLPACSGDAPPPAEGARQLSAEQEPAAPAALEAVRQAVDSLAADAGAEVSLYYRSLGAARDSLLVRADVRMHAASTMKVPVLLQLFLDQDRGERSVDDTLVVRTTFRSIVDGSPYVLDAAEDSDSTLYRRAGQAVTLRELATLMITRSSNLATNLLIDEVGAPRVTMTLRELGADSMEVLRGVEDLPAFRAGLNNTTTARDLGLVFLTLGAGERAGRPDPELAALAGLVSEGSRAEMLAILERQEFRAKIPGGLPAGVRVANKTGWITGISHDAALVFPPADPPYVLVVLTRGLDDLERAERLIAEISRHVWTFHTRADSPTDDA
jgi:beta-lactamase class A